ncbi:uncharacterized protein LOC125675574 [Ostrea edulis]|uniref:uncharacterized protein LOC125675574 n=1 Tax=Ostrea edulis TaxID=37623 RepID=UPI0024AF28CB|nr:uncharacterized protein LOC125675574 [Ostrea edulis]XP_048769272.2 uncharacterized protein LOC125675574 [Ostrea edulis]
MFNSSLIRYVLLFMMFVWDCDKGQVAANDFDHFILAFQWPVTFCENTKCGIPLPHYWTIHGFWPSKSDGSPVQDCSKVNFDEQQIPKETRSHMDRIWPDLLGSGVHSQFWSRQWKKHGTCADVPGTRTVEGYFTKAIELANRYNISGCRP